MRKLLAPIPKARTLSVMPTYQCTAHCKHCGTYSSPKETTWLDPELITSAIDQAINAGYKVVVFTGGEPTLAGENLFKYIRQVAEKRICSRIVTNACWADTEENADLMMNKLIEAGLREVNFSTGDQHARFVDFDNILRATRAAVKVGCLQTIAIMVETVEERAISKKTITDHPEYKRIMADFPKAKIKIIESPWMPLTPNNIEKYTEGRALNNANLPMHTGCNSCLTTTTLQADGRIGACCGLGMRNIPELQLGRIDEISIEEADKRGENDFLKRWIRVEGPERILAWAAAHDQSIEWENMYAHRCQTCIRLYKDKKVRDVIRDHYEEKIPDVLFREWLLHSYNPEEEEAFPETSTGEGN